MDGGSRAPGRVAKLVAIIFRDIIAVAFIGTHLVLRDPMAGSRRRPLPSWTLPRGPRRNLPKRARALRTAWLLFIFIGLPLGFMAAPGPLEPSGDRKSTRLNSSHSQNSYAAFCFEKKKKSSRTRDLTLVADTSI